MEYYKDRACVTVEELTGSEGGEAVMTLASYEHYVKSRRIHIVRRGGGLDCYALIDFESLPPRVKSRFVAKHGHPKDKLKERSITDELPADCAARDFYAEWLRPDGKYMTEEQQAEYTRNAEVLNVLIKILNDRRSKRRAHGKNTADFWASLLITSENFREQPGHTLPRGKAQLQNKMNEYKKSGYASLISGKLGNVNTTKITTEMGDQIVALKRCRIPVLSNLDIFNMINSMAAERGWKPLRSVKALVKFLHREDIEPRWYDAVYGEGKAHERYSRKNRLKPVSGRDALWYGDGTKLNIFYKAYDSKGRMVVRTTQVYEVMDAYSEVFLGYHIRDTEDSIAQFYAFKMAVETTGFRPYEIVVDNQGGHKKMMSDGFFGSIATGAARHTAPYNASGKSIESAIGRFQTEYLHKDWAYTGQNITAKSPKSRENREFVDVNTASLLTLPELKEFYACARAEWNAAPYPGTNVSRMDRYQASHNEMAKAADAVDIRNIFRLKTDKPVQFTPSGITIQVDNKKYDYEVFDAETGLPDFKWRRDNTWRKFIVSYDPSDMRQVKLYSKEADGSLRYVTDAYPYATFPRAMQDQKAGDRELIRAIIQKTVDERIIRQTEAAELEIKYGVNPEAFGFNRPGLKGISDRRYERGMTLTITPVEAPDPREEILDMGLYNKHLSNLTTLEMGSSYDKM